MEKVLMSTLMTLSKGVEATNISAAGKHTAAWCLGRLPKLYAQYHATNESRYGEEIRRLVQALIKELTESTDLPCVEAKKLAASVPGRFQELHEQLRLPELPLKGPRLSVPAALPKKPARSGGRR